MVVRNVHTNYLHFLIPNIQEEGEGDVRKRQLGDFYRLCFLKQKKPELF